MPDEIRTVRELGLERVRKFLPFEDAMAWPLDEQLFCLQCQRVFAFGDARCDWDPEPPVMEVIRCAFADCEGMLLDIIPEKVAIGVSANEP